MEIDRTAHIFDGVNSHGSFKRIQELERIAVWQFVAPPPGARVFFTTRHGGGSMPPYDSLNLGYHVSDDQ